MITEWIIKMAGGFAEWMAQFFPVLDLPDVSAGTMFANLLAMLHGLGVWVNWSALFVAIGAILAWWAGFGLFKLALKVAAFFPLVGGSG